MNLPGSAQMGYGKRFFESLPWTQLTPMPERVGWAEETPGDPLTGPQACGLTDRLLAIYVLDPRPIVIRELKIGSYYQLTRFDPVTGERAAPFPIAGDAHGEWRCDPPKDGHDWVVLLTPE